MVDGVYKVMVVVVDGVYKVMVVDVVGVPSSLRRDPFSLSLPLPSPSLTPPTSPPARCSRGSVSVSRHVHHSSLTTPLQCLSPLIYFSSLHFSQSLPLHLGILKCFSISCLCSSLQRQHENRKLKRKKVPLGT